MSNHFEEMYFLKDSGQQLLKGLILSLDLSDTSRVTLFRLERWLTEYSSSLLSQNVQFW